VAQTRVFRVRPGDRCRTVTVDNVVRLSTPARRVEEPTAARVLDIQAQAFRNQVVVSGIIRKRLRTLGIDDRIHTQIEEIPFTVFIDVPGARRGDRVSATVDIVEIRNRLFDRFRPRTRDEAERDEFTGGLTDDERDDDDDEDDRRQGGRRRRRFFRRVAERVVLRVCVRFV